MRIWWRSSRILLVFLWGINDEWAEHTRHATGKEAYGTIYRMMLGELKGALPDVKIVLCEPFMGADGIFYDPGKKRGERAWKRIERGKKDCGRI